MQASEIDPGKEYGFRESPKRKTNLQRVKVLEKVRAKWRVEWVEPNPGLQDFVKSAQLVVSWKDRRAFLKDEENWALLEEACERSWPGHDHPLSEAVDLVIDSTGERTIYVGNNGELCSTDDALDRLQQRAKTEIPTDRPGFRDRRGTLRLPFERAVTLARAFAAAEPQTVLLEVETSERRYEQEARELGNSYLVPLVQRWRAGWAFAGSGPASMRLWLSGIGKSNACGG